MKFKCAFCNSSVPINPMFDTSTCPGCGQVLANGLEDMFRDALENSQYWMRRPKSVMARAASYSNRIYDFAATGASMKFPEVEARIANRFGYGAAANSAQCVFKSGRALMDMVDTATGVMVVEVDGSTNGKLWRYVYVVFRGSAGDQSELGSGWDTTNTHNIDWRANFENDHARAPWAGAETRVHQGFLSLYLSMREELKLAVGKSIRTRPRGAACTIVVTGHSLGGGLTQLCAHDFHCSGLGKGVAEVTCFPFCPPRAGGLGFVRHFNAALCDRQVFYPSEEQSYSAAISSVQGLDPVSKGQSRGARRGLLPSEASETVDGGGLFSRGVYAADIWAYHNEPDIHAAESTHHGQEKRSSFNVFGRTQDWLKRRKRYAQSQATYYHIKNLYKIQLTGFHMPFDTFFGIEGNAYSNFH